MRRNLNQAKLQDQNISLQEAAHRQQATLNAHLRFSQRANNHRSNITNELQTTQNELTTLETNLTTVQSQLTQARLQNTQLAQEMAALQQLNSTASHRHLEELNNITATWEVERKQMLLHLEQETQRRVAAEQLTQHALETNQIQHTQENTYEQLQLRLQELQHRVQDSHAQDIQSKEEMSKIAHQLHSTHETVANLEREIGIKDKQLVHLRGQHTHATSFLSLAAMGGGASTGTTATTATTARTSKEEAQQELIEILEDDMKNMKVTYEKKIDGMNMEIERLESLR